MQRLYLIIILILFGCQSTLPDNLVTKKSHYTGALIAVEVVNMDQQSITSHSGMGFVIAKDNLSCYVVTANHVVKATYSFISYQNWESAKKKEDIEFVGADDNLDIAVLKFPLKDNNCTPINIEELNQPITLGEQVLVYGNLPIRFNGLSTRMYKTVINGVVSTIIDNYSERGFSVFASSAVIAPGFSGGAVFTFSNKNNKAQFIGMVIEKLEQKAHQGQTIPLTIIIPRNTLIESVNNIIDNYNAENVKEIFELKAHQGKILTTEPTDKVPN